MERSEFLKALFVDDDGWSDRMAKTSPEAHRLYRETIPRIIKEQELIEKNKDKIDGSGK